MDVEGHEGPRRAKRAAKAGVEVQGRELVPREPPESPGLRGQAAEARTAGRDDEVAKIEVAVRGLVTAGRDGMHVDVERPGRRRVEGQPLDARLLARLPEGDHLTLPLAGLRMAAGLEPAPELPVVEQEHPVPRRRHDHRAPREMPLDDAAIEGIGVAVEERQDLGEVARLLRVRRSVPSQQGVKG